MALLAGCSHVQEMQAVYLTPAGSVNFRKGSGIRVAVTGDRKLADGTLLAALRKEIASNGQYPLDRERPDYWIFLTEEGAFHKDNAREAAANRKVFMTTRENDSGGENLISTTDAVSSSAVRHLTAGVYRARDLAPMTYIDLIVSDGDFAPESVRDEQAYASLFANQILGRLQEAFLTGKRPLPTLLPKGVDTIMVMELSRGNKAKVIARAKQIIPEKTAEVIARLEKAEEAGEREALEAKLRNHYMLALAEELDDCSAANLRRLHARHVAILSSTDDAGLKEAIPDTLARIEQKLEFLNSLK